MTTPQGIAELLRDHRDRTGDSYAEIARKTGLSKAYIGYLQNTPPPFVLTERSREGLHQGLGIPLHVVESAAAVSAGMTAEANAPEREEGRLLARMRQLSSEDLDTVEILVSGMLRRQTKRRNANG